MGETPMPPASGTSSPGALFRAGNLHGAVEAANAAVRAAPADVPARLFLAELLLFVGKIERADVILEAAGRIDPSASLVIAEFRQLLRAEVARRQLRSDGRLPEFLSEPTPALVAALAAWVAWREGDSAQPARDAAAMESLRPRVSGTLDGAAFDDWRDACDLHAGFFEVLTTTGKYFWIPTEHVTSLVFRPPGRARDLFWRRARMTVRDGPDGEVYLPALYGTDPSTLPEPLLLGHATEWLEEAGLVRGVGRRIYLCGDDGIDIMSIGTVRFEPKAAG